MEELLDQMTAKEVLHEVHCALNRLAIQVTRNGERMITKDEFNESYDQMFMKLDQILSIVKRLDEKRIATREWLKRHGREFEEHRV